MKLYVLHIVYNTQIVSANKKGHRLGSMSDFCSLLKQPVIMENWFSAVSSSAYLPNNYIIIGRNTLSQSFFYEIVDQVYAPTIPSFFSSQYPCHSITACFVRLPKSPSILP